MESPDPLCTSSIYNNMQSSGHRTRQKLSDTKKIVAKVTATEKLEVMKLPAMKEIVFCKCIQCYFIPLYLK